MGRLKHRKTSLSRFVNSPDVPVPQEKTPLPADSQGIDAADVAQTSAVEAEPVVEEPAADALAFKPFPVECLPESVRQFVDEYARAMGCDESFLALPALAVMAGVIGNAAQIRLKSTWREPAILWTAIVAESGARKSPPLAAVTAPLNSLNQFYASIYQRRRQVYEWNLDDSRKQQRKAADESQEYIPLPAEPFAERWMVGDISFDQLALQLSRQWRGLLVCRDELDGWLSGFDMTRSSKGAGMANWLEFHGGRPMTIGRRGKKADVLQIPYASVSVTGGIQPEILKQRFTKSHLASGLFARLLFAFPPASSRTWSEVEVNSHVTSALTSLLFNLVKLVPMGNPEQELKPQIVKLTPAAKKRFAQFVNDFGKIQDNADELLAASFAKLEGYAARFALVLHLGTLGGRTDSATSGPEFE